MLALPLFLAVIAITNFDFKVIWRYFGWANQTLACITLWTITVCLRVRNRQPLIALIPALFMTCMCATFLLHAPECAINVPLQVATPIGCAIAAICLLFFARCIRPKVQNA